MYRNALHEVNNEFRSDLILEGFFQDYSHIYGINLNSELQRFNDLV